MALLAFLVAAVIVSQLSAAAQSRAREAVERRNELARLFDLSRDVLLTTESPSTLDALARHIARRFELERVAICLPVPTGWHMHQGGERDVTVDERAAERGVGARGRDARVRRAAAHLQAGMLQVQDAAGRRCVLVPLRFGTRPIGLLGRARGCRSSRARSMRWPASRRSPSSGAQLLSERQEAELVRQRADLASTLLASLRHDLRTPLTAISVAISNLQDPSLADERAHAQARLAQVELERLTRLFRDILDMARIDADGDRAASTTG